MVDFCSGSGGPVPTIERLVNAHRASNRKPPVTFQLSDLYPDIDSWIEASSHSANLSFLPQPVNATSPPIAAVSAGSAAFADSTAAAQGFDNDARVFRLFCLAFHYFDDAMARQVLTSSFQTANGFAILELQDRRPLTLTLMAFEAVLVWLTTLFWFWHSPVQLFFTYIVPVLPCIMLYDGLVSSLRTRTFDEFVDLVELAMVDADDDPDHVDAAPEVIAWEADGKSYRLDGWSFEECRAVHTWPCGYCNFIVARKVA